MSDWQGILIAVLIFGLIVYLGSRGKHKDEIYSYNWKELKKWVGAYSFWKSYGNGWNNYFNFAEILHTYDIHYLRMWLSPWKGNIAWFFPYKITNGDKNTPPEKRIYDLTQWNDEYWNSLKRFINFCAKKRIVVNLNVFDDCHLRHGWDMPINAEYHNIQGIKNGNEWYKNGLPYAKIFIDKVLKELKPYNNVIYTPCNENYDYPNWQKEISLYFKSKGIDFLDDGNSTVPNDVKHLYGVHTYHGVVHAVNINRTGNYLWSSDGGTFGGDIAEVRECALAGVSHGRGYEFYMDSGRDWDLIAILKELQPVSKQYER